MSCCFSFLASSDDQDDVQQCGRITGPPGARIPEKCKFLATPGSGFDVNMRVQEETFNLLATPKLRRKKHELARRNLAGWKAACVAKPVSGKCLVLPRKGDWGDVTGQLTKEYGTTFAVLNMANALFPGGGGGYLEATHAQEENMCRRTDCHFHLQRSAFDPTPKYYPDFKGVRSSVIKAEVNDYVYHQEMRDVINAKDGVVYLDTKNPRLCFRGAAGNVKSKDLKEQGYLVLPDDEVFPFYELKAAADDLRERLKEGEDIKDAKLVESKFDLESAKKKIRAQFTTLKKHNVRHAVLSAFGCGAFGNPATGIAQVYAELLNEYTADFDVISFAIFYPGYGPDNWTPFAKFYKNILEKNSHNFETRFEDKDLASLGA